MMYQVPQINIPAYDAAGQGLIVEFNLAFIPKSEFLINTTGKLAVALHNNLKRVIEIMSSIKKSWECLETIQYQLECSNDKFITKDSKSSSLALSIALMNVYRVINGKSGVSGFTGTGILRVDGSFESSNLETEKYMSAKRSIKDLNKFITPNECTHLYDLERLMDQYQ